MSEFKTPSSENNTLPKKAFVIHPFTHELSRRGIDPEARLTEAASLAGAINLEVTFKTWINIRQIRPNNFLGEGAIETLRLQHQNSPADVIIVDTNLSAIQQRNLERSLKAKVIDRTGLILEIFGERAQTQEGRLQVELAALNFQKSRLVRSWTHLERQRGGLGFIGGPGESQIELDRRLIRERIVRLEDELEKVKKRRILQRQNRKRTPYPIVALVGYTNAGKSTLFNRLTNANVIAKDMLFATLDPTMRKIKLPCGREVILSDTVGFISDLPTQLIAAFRATLEEVLEADIILHIRDLASPASEQQKQDVLAVLEELGINLEQIPLLEVGNKIDLLEQNYENNTSEHAPQKRLFKISAQTGYGIETLMKAIDAKLQEAHQNYRISFAAERGEVLAWLYSHGEVQKRGFHPESETELLLEVSLAPEAAAKFFANFPDVDCKTL